MQDDVLVVVDMQNDFITGSLGSEAAQAIVPNVVQLVQKFVDNGQKVLFTKDTHGLNYLESFEGKNLPVEHCIIHTPGWEICPELVKFTSEDNVIWKHIFGSFLFDDYIWNHLDGRDWYDPERANDAIHICGLCTDICVVSNALILRSMYMNRRIILHENCCAGTTPEKHQAAIEVMKSCQIEIV